MTEMSVASEVDQSSASEMTPSATTQQDGLSPAVKGGIVFCGIVAGSCIVIILIALGGGLTYDEDTELEAEVGSGIKVPTPANRQPPVKTVGTGKKQTTVTTTTTPAWTQETEGPTEPVVELPPEVKELVCTVGSAASLSKMYPPDGLCHYLYYTHIFIAGPELRSTESIHSYRTFKNVVKKYQTTRGGLAFDHRYVTAAKIKDSAIQSQLTDLANENIPHAGVLNLIARKDKMAALMSNVKGVLEALKEVQGNDENKKTIIAIGLFGYNEPQAWEMYKNWIKQATDYKADTVIAISSTIVLDTSSECKAAPPDALDANDKNFPDFKRHGELVAESTQYSNRDAVVGLSLEMGAQYYEMKSDVSNLNDIPYAPCTSGVLTGADIGCENETHITVPQSSNAVSRQWHKKAAILFDLPATVEGKVSYIKNLPARRRFSWLYFDLHWADFRLTCKQNNPFSNVEKLKEVFGI